MPRKYKREKTEGGGLEGIKRGRENERDLFFFLTHQACYNEAGKTETSILCYFNLESHRKAFLVKGTCQLIAVVVSLEVQRLLNFGISLSNNYRVLQQTTLLVFQ